MGHDGPGRTQVGGSQTGQVDIAVVHGDGQGEQQSGPHAGRRRDRVETEQVGRGCPGPGVRSAGWCVQGTQGPGEPTAH